MHAMQTVCEREQVSLLDIKGTRMCITPWLGDRLSSKTLYGKFYPSQKYYAILLRLLLHPSSGPQLTTVEVEIAVEHSTYGAVTEGYIKLRSFVTEAYWKVDDHLTSSLAEKDQHPPEHPLKKYWSWN
ncbi:uncharacterized protein RSE6_11448 [Rhynchosporium secalis]|uniref:Uncharacterized protein n=1 Tax=Rhynchosporium secalis TaxID=38038 RepID=A0A1E1MMZ7_RHYSE|nr:uncharacterized protein RSE6_11448 [Rhynchosporium secalis]